MRGKNRLRILHVVPVLVLAVVLVLLVRYAQSQTVDLFDTAGPIAEKERNLIYFALGLSLVVVVPVFTMLAVIVWRYREGNTKAKYSPNLDGSRRAEAVWWGIPALLILILSVVTWNSSHDLDPYKKLVSDKESLKVQVVSLDWKWLFIYPQHDVASINELHIPIDTPVDFELTSDAPMNSFWIPRLGGQIYTMPGMMTQLHLLADKTGTYRGQSANISGEGFAGMKFDTFAESPEDFDAWVSTAKNSALHLDQTKYDELVKPVVKYPVEYYASVEHDLFHGVMGKYMSPDGTHTMHMETAQ